MIHIDCLENEETRQKSNKGQRTSFGECVGADGMSDYVRRGSALGTEELRSKRIAASYDRVELDTSEEELQQQDLVGLGVLIRKLIPTNMYEWSRNIEMVETDFSVTDRTMVVAAPADLQTKHRFSAELEREHGHKEFLLRQRPTVGKIV